MSPTPPHIALYGQFGSGNFGNDASMMTVAAALRKTYSEVRITCLSDNPDTVRSRYGIEAISMDSTELRAKSPMLRRIRTKVASKLADLAHMLRCIPRFDAVIVPGMGEFERLGFGTWGQPYSLFVLALACRIWRRPLLLVSVGADPLPAQGLAAWFTRRTVRWASYITYRDVHSQRAMADFGHSRPIFPDVAFGLDAPVGFSSENKTVFVGVMRYYGIEDKPEIGRSHRQRYVGRMTEFVAWLTDRGYHVRVGIGDHADAKTAREIALAAADRTDSPERITWCVAETYVDLLAQISRVDYVVATRFHNIVFALLLGISTISIWYGEKGAELMRICDQGAYTQYIDDLDLDLLKRQFVDLEVVNPAQSIRRCVANLRRDSGQQVAAFTAVIDEHLRRQEA